LEPRGKPAASALYDPRSPVPIRIYARKKQEFNEEFVLSRWREAQALRRQMVPATNTGYRMAYSEGDRMPGLIADRFGDHITVAVSMQSWKKYAGLLLEDLQLLHNVQSVSLEYEGQVETLIGELPADVSYRLNGFTFFARPLSGQKTGAYLDQWENYQAARDWSHRLGLGRMALDLYTSNGGFSRHLAAGMERVDAIDSSGTAIELLEKGARIDAISNIRSVKGDVREFLQTKVHSRSIYETVVVDPPAFAKSKKQQLRARQQYFDINEKAMRVTQRGGLFITCSCSQHIARLEFEEIIREAALHNEKTLQILERRTQSPDHPILASLPETEYLKCLIFRIV
jgi:23S rRNA (cytosine1962-C5)-methyltransferase